MVSEKKPSIYDDRGSIGSSNELDEYGVWVKSEPQEMSGSENVSDPGETDLAESVSMPDLPDLELLAMDELAEAVELSSKSSYSADNDENSFTMDDYDESDGFSLDEETDDDSAMETQDMEMPDTELSGDPDIDDAGGEEAEAEESLMDFDFSDLSDPDDGLPELPAGADETGGDSGYDPDASALDEGPDEKLFDTENEIGELGFIEVSMDTFSEPPEEEAVLDDEPLTEQAIDELALDDSALDEDFSGLSLDDSFDETADLTKSLVTEDKETAGGGTPAKETDLSTQLLMKIAEELSSIRTELSTLKNEMSIIRPEASQDGASQGFFNEAEDDEKISLTGDEMDDILNADGSPSDEILELAESGIEISESDIDLAGEENRDEPQPHSFFDESEDDETIALTGDELNNILNTADFTEETGADAGGDAVFEEEAGPGGGDLEIAMEESLDDLPDEEIAPESETPAGNADEDGFMELVMEENPGGDEAEAFPADETGMDEIPDDPLNEEISLDELSAEELSAAEISIDETLIFPEDDNAEISQLREEGVEPMTAAPEPEEAGFLESDPLTLAGFDEESLDLSGAVIDEPDLSSGVQDNPVSEPSLEDIPIDLEFDEDSPGGAAPEIGEITDEELNLDVPDEIEIPLEDEEDIPLSAEADNELPYAVDDVPEDDDLALLPEGFVVEADDTQTGAGDEESLYGAAGEESFSVEDDTEAAAESPPEETEAESAEAVSASPGKNGAISQDIPAPIKNELKTVLSYMDQLLESLPDDKIEEFARSEYFDTYKKLFKELGLV